MFFKNDPVEVLEVGTTLCRIMPEGGDEDIDAYWVKMDQLTEQVVAKIRTRKLAAGRANFCPVPTPIPADLVQHLQTTGELDIRIMAAPEHVGSLSYQLSCVGVELPSGFQAIDVGSLGGVTRPYAPQYVSTYVNQAGEKVASASTRFALGLMKAGFPPTSWKGKV